MIIKKTVLTVLIILFIMVAITGCATDVKEIGYSKLDNGYQIVLDNELMTRVEEMLGNSNLIVKGVYFDGLRLYMEIYNSEKTKYNILSARLSDGNNNIIADHIFEYKNNIMVLIWDRYSGMSDVTLTVSTKEENLSTHLSLKGEDTKVYFGEVEKYFEEIKLNSVTSAKTSTLLNMDVFTLFEIDKFQLEVGDQVITSVMNVVDSQNYTVLFPLTIDTENVFIVHALDQDSNIIMSVPISLENKQ